MRSLCSLLTLGAAFAVLLPAIAAGADTPAPTSVAPPKPLPPGVVQIYVEDLHCKSCASRAARKLFAVPGVMKVQWNLKADRLTVTIQPKKTVAAKTLWNATIAGEMTPVELRYADRQLTKKHFPTAETAAKPPATPKH